MLTLYAVISRERDNFEADLKELTRRFETLDLTHTALTRERNTLSKEVLHTYLNTHRFTLCFAFKVFIRVSLGVLRSVIQ